VKKRELLERIERLEVQIDQMEDRVKVLEETGWPFWWSPSHYTYDPYRRADPSHVADHGWYVFTVPRAAETMPDGG
jgi:hypothetical protein